VIILDEAQNTTSMQMKMFLTRPRRKQPHDRHRRPRRRSTCRMARHRDLRRPSSCSTASTAFAQVKFTAEGRGSAMKLVARIVSAYEGLPQRSGNRQILNRQTAAREICRTPGSGRHRNSKPGNSKPGNSKARNSRTRNFKDNGRASALPMTEVLVVADCWAGRAPGRRGRDPPRDRSRRRKVADADARRSRACDHAGPTIAASVP